MGDATSDSDARGTPIGVLYNPISGKGRALRQAKLVSAHLSQAELGVIEKASQPSYQHDELVEFLKPLTALVVLGGDGTVRTLLPALGETQTPLYVLPQGVESHIANLFQMSDDPQQLLTALQSIRTEPHYFGVVRWRTEGKEEPFFLMVSAGFDAQVVQQIHRARNGPIGLLGYYPPSFMCMIRRLTGSLRPPTISLIMEDNPIIQEQAGYLNIANSSRYAQGLKLVPNARTDRECLNGSFFPTSGTGLPLWLGWLFSSILRRSVDLSGAQMFEGNNLELCVHDCKSYPLQADGDYIGSVPEEGVSVELAKSPIQIITS